VQPRASSCRSGNLHRWSVRKKGTIFFTGTSIDSRCFSTQLLFMRYPQVSPFCYLLLHVVTCSDIPSAVERFRFSVQPLIRFRNPNPDIEIQNCCADSAAPPMLNLPHQQQASDFQCAPTQAAPCRLPDRVGQYLAWTSRYGSARYRTVASAISQRYASTPKAVALAKFESTSSEGLRQNLH
jgi:hypothetical protein